MLTMPGSSRNHPNQAVEEDDGNDRGCVRGVRPHHIEGQDRDRVFTREADAGVQRYIQRKDSGPGVQPDERVCRPRGER